MIVLLVFSAAAVAAFGARIGWRLAASAEQLPGALTSRLIGRIEPPAAGSADPDTPSLRPGSADRS